MSASNPALSAEQLGALRDSLVRLRAENESDLSEARAVLATMTGDATLTEASLREVAGNAEYMIDDATTIIGQIDAALARMTEGSFGVCVKCGNAIAFERLEARPYGTTCVPCGS